MMTTITANVRVQRWLGFVVMATIVWVAGMSNEVSRFDKKNNPHLGRWDSPVVALELAGSPDSVRDILGAESRDHNVRVMQYNTYMDCVFIVLYALVFWLFADAYRSGSSLAPLIKTAIVVAAVFDYAENFGLLQGLRDVANLASSTVSFTHAVSLIKWSAFAAALWLLGWLLWTITSHAVPHSGMLRVIMAFTFLAAAITTAGVLANSARVMGLVSVALLPVLLLTVVVFLRRQTSN
jgi:hypothetical protein